MDSYRETPKNRLVLLGASNLTLSLRLTIHLMQQRLGGPSEILVALGHGRAYGTFTQMLWRGLPGMTNCDLWRQLDSIEIHPTYALLTDIGNDILYGLPPQQILRALEWCINQLQNHSAQIVVTNLPITSIKSLSERRYIFFRNIFYPSCQLSRDETINRAEVVHHGLVDMAAQWHFKLYEQEPDWFGLDGIHVNYWQRKAYYQDILRQFSDLGLGRQQDALENKQEFLLTWQRRPEFAYKTVLGRISHCQQPSGQLADGSLVCKC
ncbi:SGNH/GDSL hydrolase family protein [Nitrosomonas ureae]|uniref:GDSL-like Lipase/Acylhydrolase family protein n=1 Tax=Nitrosomonas ureae TaxID=44577 RepID=A0A1H2F9M8_9PROT|nr:SGNH/GDSL hydrolase family protein [Nitrosomonas ureae]ALQ52099.1 hypothetical protein ATY38_13275 [Nitrosomonas ureae]SDU03995.1 hypothetical protein SAMN05216406_11911 [Nitrosomonas ureae]